MLRILWLSKTIGCGRPSQVRSWKCRCVCANKNAGACRWFWQHRAAFSVRMCCCAMVVARHWPSGPYCAGEVGANEQPCSRLHAVLASPLDINLAAESIPVSKGKLTGIVNDQASWEPVRVSSPRPVRADLRWRCLRPSRPDAGHCRDSQSCSSSAIWGLHASVAETMPMALGGNGRHPSQSTYRVVVKGEFSGYNRTAHSMLFNVFQVTLGLFGQTAYAHGSGRESLPPDVEVRAGERVECSRYIPADGATT